MCDRVNTVQVGLSDGIEQAKIGKKRNDGVYVVVESHVRLLLTRDDFTRGGQLHPDFEPKLRAAAAKALYGMDAPDGLIVETVAVSEFEPGNPR